MTEENQENNREKALYFLRATKAILESIDWYSVLDVVFDAEDDGKTTTLIGGKGKTIVDVHPTFEKIMITIITKPGALPIDRDEHGFIKKREVEEDDQKT